MADTPNLAIETVARNFAMKMVVAGLGWLGGAIVAHGWATDDQVHQALDPVAQIVVGVVLSLGASVLAWYRAREKRVRELAIRSAPASAVPVK